ncbi:stage II sporulation protein P [Thermoanaerobacterium sp. DL9XJH110]|uniref:stage II sporulation protein P n=1 Tax=Thermoanaerobacterium sp. DL9XJH110 TaxID=3386643 RepID=UPI003BB57812
MTLIKFKVIKVKRYVLYFMAALLITCLAAVFLRVDRDSDVIPAFGWIQLSRTERSIIENLRVDVLKRFLSWGLPVFDIFDDGDSSIINFSLLVEGVSRLATSVDIYSPRSYFSLQIPLISLIETQMTITPGVEVMPDGTGVENEHEPVKNPPVEPPPDMEKTEVEKIIPVRGKPLVLIYHTHTTESYMPSKAFNYNPRDKAYHTDDLNYSVVKVGEVLAGELNKLGIPTIQNKTVHDVPTYMTSYSNSMKTVQEVLKKNPSIKIVLDIHRDAPVPDPQRSRELTTVKIEGKTYSRIMFVIGSDKIFPHPYWKENYRFALMLNDKLEELYPGISREIDLREQRFNQHLSKKAVLVEIGSHGNTMEESIESARAFARALAEVVKELSILN